MRSGLVEELLLDGELRVEFRGEDGPIIGVENVSFSIAPGETVCVVGESGSGKSVTSLSLMRLVEFGGGENPVVVSVRLIRSRESGDRGSRALEQAN